MKSSLSVMGTVQLTLQALNAFATVLVVVGSFQQSTHDVYIDTFNRGGGSPINLFQSPSVPDIKPATAGNAKFFVPTPMSPVEKNELENSNNSECDSVPALNGLLHLPAPSSVVLRLCKDLQA